jgi:hypothetical protein
MQLRVRRVTTDHSTRGGMQIFRGDQLPGGLLHHPSAVAAADGRHRLSHVLDSLLDRVPVSLLDRPALVLVAERPSNRHRLRGAERHVDPTTTATVRPRTPQPAPSRRMPALHQRDEVRAVNGATLDPELRERVRRDEPPAGRLCRLAARRQVVVAALWLDGLTLQIPGVAAAFRGTNAGSGHHYG